MIDLKDLNRAVCDLYRQALNAAGSAAEILPELVAEYDIDMALFLYHQNNLSEELIDFLNRGE